MCRPRLHRVARLRGIVTLSLLTIACGAGTMTQPNPSEDPDAQGETGEVIVDRDIVFSDPDGADNTYTSLDVYRVAGRTDAPALVFVHGGGWVSGDKSNVVMPDQLVDHFVIDREYAFVAVNYRLQNNSATPGTTYLEQTQDVAAAIAWIAENDDSIGVDSSRMVLMGYSAGAHLVALVATDPGYLANHGMTAGELAGVVPMDVNAYDIPRSIAEACDLGYCLAEDNLPAIFGADVEVQRAASPIPYIARGTAYPPFMIISAEYQGPVSQSLSPAQSDYLVSALTGAGSAAEHHHGLGRSHQSLALDYGTPDDPVTAAVSGFLDDVVP